MVYLLNYGSISSNLAERRMGVNEQAQKIF
jgi:hypothetical protein